MGKLTYKIMLNSRKNPFIFTDFIRRIFATAKNTTKIIIVWIDHGDEEWVFYLSLWSQFFNGFRSTSPSSFSEICHKGMYLWQNRVHKKTGQAGAYRLSRQVHPFNPAILALRAPPHIRFNCRQRQNWADLPTFLQISFKIWQAFGWSQKYMEKK